MRYNELLNRIDEINRQDPNQEQLEGQTVAKEYLYSQRMADCLHRASPDAPETLKIAVYAQHINRWHIPRVDYPAGREGYLRWRRELAEHHARLTADLMRQCGYNDSEISEVCDLIRKKALKSNPQSQTLEDVACLVFLEHYLGGMMKSHSDEKLAAIIGKTWKKMSENGRKQALKIDYTVAQRAVIEKALGAEPCG